MSRYGRGRARWGVVSSKPRIIKSLGQHPCRVCGGAIARDEEVLHIAWGVEQAHVRCGWEKPEEKAVGQR